MESNQLRDEKIRQILFHDWDPILVNYNEKLVNEYDDCIPKISLLLETAPTLDAVIAQLLALEDHLGAHTTNDRRNSVAAALLSLV